MYCRTCMHWRRPPAAVDSYGKVAHGICGIDGRQSHPTYTCVDHEDFASTEGRLGLTTIEILWLRANRDHNSEATNIVRFYNAILASPHDTALRAKFQVAVSQWRRDRPLEVLEPHSKKRGVPTGDHAGGAEESTHAHQFARQPSDP